MQLSANLSLAEVIRSETAKRIGVSNMPTPQHIENFKKLAANIFQPIREHFGKPILISSGYRSAELNKAQMHYATTAESMMRSAMFSTTSPCMIGQATLRMPLGISLWA